jgi:serine/threonine protein kinase
MVHRDLKPQKILMTPHGHVVLIDFGLAQPIDLAYRPLAPIGTPHYAPTEQWMGVLDPRTDVYAPGVVAEQLFAGLSIPVAADRVIAQAQAPTPAQRFADVTSFGRALLDALHPQPHWRRYIPAWSRRAAALLTPPRQRSAVVGV